MDKGMETIEELTQIMREGAEKVQKHFDSPDDDWVPMMTLVPPLSGPLSGLIRSIVAADGRRLIRSMTNDRSELCSTPFVAAERTASLMLSAGDSSVS